MDNRIRRVNRENKIIQIQLERLARSLKATQNNLFDLLDSNDLRKLDDMYADILHMQTNNLGRT